MVVVIVFGALDGVAADAAVTESDSAPISTIVNTQKTRSRSVSLCPLCPLCPLWLLTHQTPDTFEVTSYTQPPVPQPFPRPGSSPPSRPAQPPPSQPATPPARPAPAQTEGAPTEAMLGVHIYPGSQFLASYDAGRGQRYYIFGSAASFVDLVTYYRTVLKQRGELVFDVPATHEFDVGRYREETMAFPPGVTIKDYQSDVSQGYPNPKPGGQPARFPTLIQIVPVTEK
jgi:hypothetical protein